MPAYVRLDMHLRTCHAMVMNEQGGDTETGEVSERAENLKTISKKERED